jgi:hypothetical protein
MKKKSTIVQISIIVGLIVLGVFGAFISPKLGFYFRTPNMVANVPVLDGAHDVGRIYVKGELHQKLYYTIKKPYPNVEALDFYDKYLTEKGYERCVVIDDEGWRSSISMTNDSERIILHSASRYFINRDEAKISTVILRYQSQKKGGGEKDIPDNDVQEVSVLMWSGFDPQALQRHFDGSCKKSKTPAQK